MVRLRVPFAISAALAALGVFAGCVTADSAVSTGANTAARDHVRATVNTNGDDVAEQLERDRQLEREVQQAIVPAGAPDKQGTIPARDRRFADDTTMSVHLLDVGQGAATLLEFPCGVVLIDTGGELNDSFNGAAALMQQLEAFFARRADLKRTIDLLVITHPHIDHVRGLPLLADSYTVRNVVDNGRDGEASVAAEVRVLNDLAGRGGHRRIKTSELKQKGGLIDDVVDPLKCSPVDPKIRVLSGSLDSDPGWGTSKYGKRHFDNENNHSVVVRVDFGNASILVTGDLEEVAIHDLIERYAGTRWLDVDVYQAGHHGSANGTTRELVAATTPLLALIAMGDEARHHSWTAWAYGHPRAGIVDLLDDGVAMKRPKVVVPVGTGVKKFVPRTLEGAVYGTGWDGAVVVDMDADGQIMVRQREAVPAS
ncbi:MAG TPA: MBL fold metallo-hydrolase [Myxococcota bacterium]